MRICIYGAGAVGGNLAVRLANAGHRISVVARGANLEAIRSRGLTLIVGEQKIRADVSASDEPAELGEQDLVISTLKAPALPGLATRIGPLLGRNTPVVFAQNGIPWWYADGLGAGRSAPDLSMLDPDGGIRRAVGIERTLGCVIYSSNDQAAPGVIVNTSAHRNRLFIAEIDDRESLRLQDIRASLEPAGIEAPPVEDLRQVIWEKLGANLSISVLSFLTEQTSRAVFENPHLRPISNRLAQEVIAVAKAHGISGLQHAGAPASNHKSSMLQDLERGRPVESDALIAAPLAFARAASVDTPILDTIAGLFMHKASGERHGRARLGKD